MKAAALWSKHGISEATLYNWRSKYGGLEVTDLRRLKELEEENRRLNLRKFAGLLGIDLESPETNERAE